MTGHQPDLDDLEVRLRALGHDLLEAPTPDLRPGVRERISAEAPSPPRRASRHTRRTTIAAVVASAVISATAAAAAASPDVRARLNNLIHFHGIDISHRSIPPPKPVAPKSDLGLGTPVSFAAAQRAVTFRIRQPGRLGDPHSVLLIRSQAGAIVTLVYRPSGQLPRAAETGAGALVTEFAGGIDRRVFHKILLGIGHTRATTVNGAPAIWAEGPQELFLITANIDPYGLPPRLSANSLIWAAGGITYRLEADLPLSRMRAIAESIL